MRWKYLTNLLHMNNPTTINNFEATNSVNIKIKGIFNNKDVKLESLQLCLEMVLPRITILLLPSGVPSPAEYAWVKPYHYSSKCPSGLPGLHPSFSGARTTYWLWTPPPSHWTTIWFTGCVSIVITKNFSKNSLQQ